MKSVNFSGQITNVERNFNTVYVCTMNVKPYKTARFKFPTLNVFVVVNDPYFILTIF